MRVSDNWQYQLEIQRDIGNDWFYQDDYLSSDFYDNLIEDGYYYVFGDDWVPESMVMDYVEEYIVNDQEFDDVQSMLNYLDDIGVDYTTEII